MFGVFWSNDDFSLFLVEGLCEEVKGENVDVKVRVSYRVW